MRYLGAFAMRAIARRRGGRAGVGPKNRRHPQNVLTRQPGQHVDPREATFVAEGPMMGVFNNLVVFDQQVKQNSLDSIVPDLATAWSWNEDGTELTSRCAKASPGTTANRSWPRMSSAPLTC